MFILNDKQIINQNDIYNKKSKFVKNIFNQVFNMINNRA